MFRHNSLANQKVFSVTNRPRPVVLCILDGWGYREETDGNAIAQAQTPVFDRLMASQPWALLKTSATDVGLPAGQMGNSEVGHTNIGAGRVVLQDLPRIDAAIADGSIGTMPALSDLIEKCRSGSGRCHLLGLVSPGGVHSHQKQMAALASVLSEAGLSVEIYAVLDGRDTPPRSAKGYLDTLQRDIAGLDRAGIATVSGRYYAMDRDSRWDRIARAYDAIVAGQGPRQSSANAVIEAAYEEDQTDEFVVPTVVESYQGMNDGDALVVANFRADRVRQLLNAMLLDSFDEFDRSKQVRLACAAGMTSYSSELDRVMTAIFPPLEIEETLGEAIAKAGLRQLRIAETEKYAHVTFFFNGGEERVFEGEDRILVPSPKVATYDLKPQMSAPEVTDKLVVAIELQDYDLIVCNYANTDMVGHTGMLEPAIAAVEAVDKCLGRVQAAVERSGGVLLITADHGNAERMLDADGGAHTAHTTDRVPLVVVNASGVEVVDGRLCDVAPTIFDIMGLATPIAMNGSTLIKRHPSGADTATAVAARAGI